MPSWPTSLPAPLVAGYALSPVDPVARTDMEVGASRSRRRTRARNDRVDVSWLMSDSQMAAFRAWYDDDATGISGGAAWFDVSLPIGDGGASPVEARFQSIWKAQRDSSMWRVSATLEVR